MQFDPIIVGGALAAAVAVVGLVAVVTSAVKSKRPRARAAGKTASVSTNSQSTPAHSRPHTEQLGTAFAEEARSTQISSMAASSLANSDVVLAQVLVSALDWPTDSPLPSGLQNVNAVPVRMSAVGEPSALRLTASGDQIGVGCNFVINVAPLDLGGVDPASLKVVAEFALAGGSLHGANINTYWSVGQTSSKLQVFDLHELCGDGEPGKLCRVELPLSAPLASAERLRVQFRVRNKVGSYRGGLPDVAIDLYGVTLTGVRN